jgi:hypothetical protein
MQNVLHYLLQLCDTPVRVRMLLAVGPGSSSLLVVSATILHAPLLHQLQHQLPALLSVRDHLPEMHVSADSEEFQEVPLQPHEPTTVHLNVLAGN